MSTSKVNPRRRSIPDSDPPILPNMNSKALIWIGMTVGSIAGGFLPALWGGDLLSFAGLFCSGAGGIAGIWAGYKIGSWE